MGFSRRLSFSVILFCSCWVFETTGRAIPHLDADYSGSELDGLSKRADISQFVTMYNLFDHITPPSSKGVQVDNDGSPRLRPIAVVLETMQAASLEVTPAVVLDQPTATILAVKSSPTTPHAFTRPPLHFGGPGPVLLPSSVYKSLSVSKADALNDANATVAPPKHLVVLGFIIGGILLFTLCVFVLMAPSNSFAACAWLKRAAGERGKPPKGYAREPEKALQDSSSWGGVTSPSTLGKLPSVETVKDRESERPIRDTVIDVVAALSSSESNEYPTSKFSMCSSEYPPSSTYTSDLASNSSTVKAIPAISRQLTDADGATKPIRPPRPPTAESPALSDSVYLAFSDQPYVIVAPQPLTDNDLLPGLKSPRKLLTSTEFVSLHLRITGGRLPPGMDRSSLDSHHSRTKSAPAMGRRNRMSYLKIDIPPSKSVVSRKSHATPMKIMDDDSSTVDEEVLLEDIEGDSDVQESMVRRVMKHRRSRSASGWAYPSKGKWARRPFKLEEEWPMKYDLTYPHVD